MKKVLLAGAVLAALVVPAGASAATSGAYLPLSAGKAEIKWTVAGTQVGSRFASKVNTCYKPRADRVSCFWQSREMYEGSWYICFGIAVATDRWSYVNVNLGRNWVDNCYPSYDPSFI